MTPTRRIPAMLTRQTNTIQPNIVQKATLYPAMRARGVDRSAYDAEALVTEEATTCVTLSPMAPPSCAQVLKTAPPSACVFLGKMLEMMSRPTVKRMSQLMGVSI